MPDQTKIGRIVHISRGYTVAEILDGERLLGFSVFGYRSDTSRIYASQAEALAALESLADAK